MSSLSHLKSSDLEPLFPSETHPSTSSLQVLLLNGTGIGDDSAPFIGSCEALESLGVAATRFTSTATIYPPPSMLALTKSSQLKVFLRSWDRAEDSRVWMSLVAGTSPSWTADAFSRKVYTLLQPLSLLTSLIGVGGISKVTYNNTFENPRHTSCAMGMRHSLKNGLH